jgi:hypothetical protein
MFSAKQETVAMSFTVTASSRRGTVAFHRNTAVTALEMALGLVGERMDDVRVADAQGRMYAPADFDRCFVQNRGKVDAPRP